MVVYQIKKAFNNNAVLVNDEKGLEKILIGRGIAFGKKRGDFIVESMIEKTFIVDAPDIKDNFIQLTNDIPVNHLELVTKIINDAEESLNYTFDDMTYIGLADHISYALNRYKKGHKITNALLFEIKKFYPKEYAVGEQALKTIAYYEGITLADDEAGFIALHFVNGEQDNDISHTMLTTEVLKKVTLIVEDYLNIELDEKSLNYVRFITHLRFFVQRVTSNEIRNEGLPEIFEQVIASCPLAAKCVDVVIQYLASKLKCEVYPEERLYLILHVQRLTNCCKT